MGPRELSRGWGNRSSFVIFFSLRFNGAAGVVPRMESGDSLNGFRMWVLQWGRGSCPADGR